MEKDQCSAFQESKDERVESNQGAINSDAGSLYSEQEARDLEGKLVSEETVREAQQDLTTGLEKGQCNEGISPRFYSLTKLFWDAKNIGSIQCKDEIEKIQKEFKEKFLSGAASRYNSKETHLVSLIASFLSDYKNGSSIDSICSCLKKIFPNICAEEVENLMKKLPHIFEPVEDVQE